MRKRSIVAAAALVLLLAGAMAASAQFRLDANISWPFYLGVNLSSATLGTGTQGIDLSKLLILVPDVELYYQFGTGSLRGGVGARVYTLIIESVIYPSAFLELDLNPIVINANVGGGAYAFFGILPLNAGAAQLFLPDLNVAVKLTDWFRLGAGVFGLFIPDLQGEVVPFAAYINARFVVMFK